jgi:ACT domain-containing protein
MFVPIMGTLNQNGQKRKSRSGEDIPMKKTIITVVGKDTVGIIAKVCAYLAENGINILDISQTIVQGYFNMMMIVDTGDMAKPFGDMADEMTALGEKIGVVIKCQKEEIFDKMHRI